MKVQSPKWSRDGDLRFDLLPSLPSPPNVPLIMFADDVTSDFSPPELAIASAPWAKVAVEKTYLYSLRRTLLQGLHSTEEQVGI